MSTPLWSYFYNPTWLHNFFLSPQENLDFTGKVSIKPGKFLSFCNSGRVIADSSSSHVSKWQPALRSSPHCWGETRTQRDLKHQPCCVWRQVKTHRGVGDGGETAGWERELLPGLEMKWGLIFPEDINLVKDKSF